MDLAQYMDQRARLVNEALDRYTSAGREEDCLKPVLEGIPPVLLEAMRYSLLAGGKRLRPLLVMAAAELCGLAPDKVMPTACALEMIHTYSLIHDDLPCMDDDDLRRGRPTNHKVYGEAVATLAGDALLTMAFELLALQSQVEGTLPERVTRVVAEMAAAAGAAGMVGGQVEDLLWEEKDAPPEQLERIHLLKTGALFRAALRCGAILGGAAAPEIAALDRYAYHFGLAFQIQDDVLDVVGDVAKMGKAVGSDARQSKSTYVSHFGLEGARQMAREHVAAAQEALAPFGERGRVLAALAQFVIDREG